MDPLLCAPSAQTRHVAWHGRAGPAARGTGHCKRKGTRATGRFLPAWSVALPLCLSPTGTRVWCLCLVHTAHMQAIDSYRPVRAYFVYSWLMRVFATEHGSMASVAGIWPHPYCPPLMWARAHTPPGSALGLSYTCDHEAPSCSGCCGTRSFPGLLAFLLCVSECWLPVVPQEHAQLSCSC